MTERLKPNSFFETPATALEHYVAVSVQRAEPVPIESDEGRLLYRALAQYIWAKEQRPVVAADVRELWETIDSIKRGSAVHYEIYGIHYWAAEFANAIHTDSVQLSEEENQKLAAWLDDWPNICVLGQTGRGKSTTINRLFGAKMAATSERKGCTSTVTDYRLVTGTFMNRPTGVVLWDVPGYGDGKLPWKAYVKLYRRMVRKCDVVVFMLDHRATESDDFKMFKKLRKNMRDPKKLVVCINKIDLLSPDGWDTTTDQPTEALKPALTAHVLKISNAMKLRGAQRVVPISALNNWNTRALMASLIGAAGEKRAPKLVRALSKLAGAQDIVNEGSAEFDLGRRFGIKGALRERFRRVLAKAQKKRA
jgi:small GTP-binding protein